MAKARIDAEISSYADVPAARAVATPVNGVLFSIWLAVKVIVLSPVIVADAIAYRMRRARRMRG